MHSTARCLGPQKSGWRPLEPGQKRMIPNFNKNPPFEPSACILKPQVHTLNPDSQAPNPAAQKDPVGGTLVMSRVPL